MKLRFEGTNSIYEQIYLQYKKYIEVGVFSHGERLPSVRDLAKELGVNPNTVDRAYLMLANDGIVVSMPKKGVFVNKPNGQQPAGIVTKATQAIANLKAEGLDKQTLVGIVNSIYGQPEPNP